MGWDRESETIHRYRIFVVKLLGRCPLGRLRRQEDNN
jgi:hypothetical protein